MTAQSFVGKTFFVTGAAGFIGTHTCRMLLDAGAQVIGIDNFEPYYDPEIKKANIAPFAVSYGDRWTMLEGSIEDLTWLMSVFKQYGSAVDQVIHLAGRPGVRVSMEQPEAFMLTNVMGTQYVLEGMKAVGVKKMVFASSSSVYGNCMDPPFREEQDVTKPVSVYAATKIMGESLLHSYSSLWGIQVVALRFFTVYGASQRPDLAIHKFSRLMVDGKPLPVYGEGKLLRDYTYIDDILSGILGAIQYDRTPFEVINLGESNTISSNDLIGLLELALGVKALKEYYPIPPGDIYMTCACIDKARDLLNYHPKTSIEMGIPLFVQWFQQHAQPALTKRSS